MSAALSGFLGAARRNLFVTICIVLSLAFVGGAVHFWLRSAAIEGSHGEKEAEIAKMYERLRQGPDLQTELALIRDHTRQIESNLVVEGSVSENKAYFVKMELQPGILQLNDQGLPLVLEEENTYRVIPFNLKVVGTFEQAAAFLHSVETGPRLSTITSFSLRRNGEPPSPVVILDLAINQLARK